MAKAKKAQMPFLPEGMLLFPDAVLRREQYEADRRTAFEERVVKAILRQAGIIRSLAVSRQEAARLNRVPRLSLRWFAEEYPKFPCLLMASPVDYVSRMNVPELFKSLLKTGFYRAWQEHGVEVTDDSERWLGLVFDWVGVGLMVFHNQLPPALFPGSRMIWQGARSVFVLERLVDFLLVCGDWKHE